MTANDQERSYTLYWDAMHRPPGGVRITTRVPSSWSETITPTGGPDFALAPTGTPTASILLIASDVADDRARIDAALAYQFDGAAVTRAERGDGRIWAVHRRAPGHVHARMFVPAPERSVVVAVALLLARDAGWLAEIEAVFDTIRVA
jgi:hypothetical protein